MQNSRFYCHSCKVSTKSRTQHGSTYVHNLIISLKEDGRLLLFSIIAFCSTNARIGSQGLNGKKLLSLKQYIKLTQPSAKIYSYAFIFTSVLQNQAVNATKRAADEIDLDLARNIYDIFGCKRYILNETIKRSKLCFC